MPVQAAANANIGAFAQRGAGAPVKLRVGRDMNAVGAKPLGARDVVFDEAGDAGRLNRVKQTVEMHFVGLLIDVAEQHTSRRGVRKGLGELGFQLRGQERRDL